MNLDVITINNFYTNPDEVRRDALGLPFTKEETIRVSELNLI